MKTYRVPKLWAWSLGIFLLCSPTAYAQRVHSPLQEQDQSASVVLQELAQADVVYLGETHERSEDHKAQLEILQELHRLNPRLAIALEMFQRPYQEVLDQYLAGEISEAQLQEQSEYDERWGFPWEYYAPILRFAQENQIPVLALNTPTEVTYQVARGGLESLKPEDYEFIPPDSEIYLDNHQYRQRIREVYNQFHQHHGSIADFDNFFAAQILWDETMAEGVAEFVNQNPDRLVVVLAGQGHIVYGDGIPSRVARRLGGVTHQSLEQRSLLINPPEDAEEAEGAIADYFWITD